MHQNVRRATQTTHRYMEKKNFRTSPIFYNFFLRFSSAKVIYYNIWCFVGTFHSLNHPRASCMGTSTADVLDNNWIWFDRRKKWISDWPKSYPKKIMQLCGTAHNPKKGFLLSDYLSADLHSVPYIWYGVNGWRLESQINEMKLRAGME